MGETGEKESRLHRKTTVEMKEAESENVNTLSSDVLRVEESECDKKGDDDQDVVMESVSAEMEKVSPQECGAESAEMEKVEESTAEHPQEKMSPQRMWTKTNVMTGEKEERLHRKDTVELGLGNQP